MFTVPYPLSRPLRAPGLRALSSAPSRSHLPPTPCPLPRPCTDCSLPASPPSSRRTHVLTSSFTYSSPAPLPPATATEPLTLHHLPTACARISDERLKPFFYRLQKRYFQLSNSDNLTKLVHRFLRKLLWNDFNRNVK